MPAASGVRNPVIDAPRPETDIDFGWLVLRYPLEQMPSS
jgi:hypothetical protein